jgi:hypothetical protein
MGESWGGDKCGYLCLIVTNKEIVNG